MIESRPSRRTVRSGRSLGAVLAAAGLFSLAAAVTPAWADPDDYVREENNTFTPNYRSYLHASTGAIDLGIDSKGAKIRDYNDGEAMKTDFTGERGGLGLTAQKAITIYNGLHYISGGPGKYGLTSATLNDQSEIVASSGQALYDSGVTPRETEKVKEFLRAYAANHTLPKLMADGLLEYNSTNPSVQYFWSSTSPATFKDRLAILGNRYIQEHGLFFYSQERLTFGSDVHLDLNGTDGWQAGYLQAPVIVTRGQATFDTAGVAPYSGNGLTVYTDRWNIMGGLSITGKSPELGVGSVAFDTGEGGRHMPQLVLQGRTDLYDNANRGSLEYWAPNLFEADEGYSGQVAWQDPANNPANGGSGPYLSRTNNLITFNADTDPFKIFRSIVSAGSTNSFTMAHGPNTNAFLRTDVLTSLGVEVFTGDGATTSGQINLVATGRSRDEDGQPVTEADGSLESIGVRETGQAGLYAARWNLGQSTFRQASVGPSALKRIFDDTAVWVDEVDGGGNPVDPGVAGAWVYGDDKIDIAAGQPGANRGGQPGMGDEGQASFNYIRYGLKMEDDQARPEDRANGDLISYQALRSKIIFDQQGAEPGVSIKDNTSLNLDKINFYGWFNAQDARSTITAAALAPKVDGGITWLETTGGLKLYDLKGLENLESIYNPFTDSPFLNFKTGYLDAEKTKFGLVDFSLKAGTLSGPAPAPLRSLARALERAPQFDAMSMPTHAYQFAESDGANYQYNNLAVKFSPDGKPLKPDGTPLDSNNGADAQFIQDHLRYIELDDLQFQAANGYSHVYNRRHSIENILFLSPSQAQYRRDLARLSAGGNLDAVRLADFATMRSAFKRLGPQGGGPGPSAGGGPATGAVWGQTHYSRTMAQGDQKRGYAPFDITRHGATVGYEHQAFDDRVLMGGYVGYTRPELDGRGRDIKADDLQFGLYAQTYLPLDVSLSLGLGYGRQKYELERDVAIGRSFQADLPIGFGEQLYADYRGQSFLFSLELARRFDFDGGLFLAPSLSYDFNRVEVDGYHEYSKRRWNLAGDPMHKIPSIGHQVEDMHFTRHIFRLGSALGWAAEESGWEGAVKAHWVHNGGDNKPQGRAALVSATGRDSFTISGGHYDRNQINYGLDLKYNPPGSPWSVTVAFEGQTGPKESVYSGNLGVLYQF